METWISLGQTQPLASKLLANSIQKNRISHAYLLQGGAGTGKKKLAKLLARTLLCEQREGVNPCGVCSICKRVDSGNHPDVHWVVKDGASIKREQIIQLRKEFHYTGYEQNKKIYIIANAETLTVNAANQILKYLEEPDEDTTAILLTENGQSILQTIRSRCQIIDLQPLNQSIFKEKLMSLESPTISEHNANLLSILTHDLEEAIMMHEANTVYQIRELVKDFLNEILEHYEDRYLFLHDRWFPLLKDRESQALGLEMLLLSFRDFLHYQSDADARLLFFAKDEELLKRYVETWPAERILKISKQILDAKQQLRQYINPTLLMENLALTI